MLEKIIKSKIAVKNLSGYSWFRKMHGGHWDCWQGHIGHEYYWKDWLSVEQCCNTLPYYNSGTHTNCESLSEGIFIPYLYK